MTSTELCAKTGSSLQCLFLDILWSGRSLVFRNYSGCGLIVRGPHEPWENFLLTANSEQIQQAHDCAIPVSMQAAVYRGQSVVQVEEVPTPSIGPGELLVRVEACGICHTDLKKI